MPPPVQKLVAGNVASKQASCESDALLWTSFGQISNLDLTKCNGFNNSNYDFRSFRELLRTGNSRDLGKCVVGRCFGRIDTAIFCAVSIKTITFCQNKRRNLPKCHTDESNQPVRVVQ